MHTDSTSLTIHRFYKLKAATVLSAGVIEILRFPFTVIICTFIIKHQYAYVQGRNPKELQTKVNDESLKVPDGKQGVVPLDDYCIPLNLHSSLTYTKLCPHTCKEPDTLCHVIITGGSIWFPARLKKIWLMTIHILILYLTQYLILIHQYLAFTKSTTIYISNSFCQRVWSIHRTWYYSWLCTLLPW